MQADKESVRNVTHDIQRTEEEQAYRNSSLITRNGWMKLLHNVALTIPSSGLVGIENEVKPKRNTSKG